MLKYPRRLFFATIFADWTNAWLKAIALVATGRDCLHSLHPMSSRAYVTYHLVHAKDRSAALRLPTFLVCEPRTALQFLARMSSQVDRR